jgi:hypothetical protein
MYIYNPSYSGGRDLEDHSSFEASPDKKLVRPSSQQTSQAWWCAGVPATQEAEVGQPWAKTPDYLKNN